MIHRNTRHIFPQTSSNNRNSRDNINSTLPQDAAVWTRDQPRRSFWSVEAVFLRGFNKFQTRSTCFIPRRRPAKPTTFNDNWLVSISWWQNGYEILYSSGWKFVVNKSSTPSPSHHHLYRCSNTFPVMGGVLPFSPHYMCLISITNTNGVRIHIIYIYISIWNIHGIWMEHQESQWKLRSTQAKPPPEAHVWKICPGPIYLEPWRPRENRMAGQLARDKRQEWWLKQQKWWQSGDDMGWKWDEMMHRLRGLEGFSFLHYPPKITFWSTTHYKT